MSQFTNEPMSQSILERAFGTLGNWHIGSLAIVLCGDD
jgi:hypothetical protein